MAKYTQISYGSTGSNVSDLQKLLNKNGYSLDVDGSFGPKTRDAVRDYQKKNNLSVDGIVGDQTWGSLKNANSQSSTTGATQTSSKASTGFNYGSYKESDAVRQAQQMLNEQMAQKPGEYKSTWQDQLNDTLQQILNREDFKYDLNGDALYQQYKDQYMLQGQQAMMDTMGQAAAMTGGYGNSYAQTAGQQTYQGHLQQLNDRIPELYNMALQKYQMEGQELTDRFSMLGAREEQDYGRYRDSVSDYYSELDRLTNQYNTERDYDYSKWADGRDFDYNKFADDRAYKYQQERDKVEDAQWQKEFDEAKRQYDQQYALKAGSSGGSSGAGSSGGSGGNGGRKASNKGGGANNGGLSAAQVKALQKALGVDQDGSYGPKSKSAAGGLSADEAYKKYVLGEGKSPQASTPDYGSITRDLNTYIKNGASKSNINNYLRLAYNQGYITAAQYQKLKNTFAPRGNTY